MEAYMETLPENMMPLDFSSSVRTEPSEPFILDLSSKNHNSRSSHSISSESRPNSSVGSEKQSEEEYPPKNPTFVMTPPTETAIRDRIMYEVAYKCCNMTDRDLIGGYHPMLPMAVPMPMEPVPALYPPNHITEIDLRVGTFAGLTSSPSTSEGAHSRSMSPEQSKKAPRPFKAYPKDPLNVGEQINTDSIEAYKDFRNKMMESVKRSNATNTKMRRASKTSQPGNAVDGKDAAYWERRRKNNEAAKRSRDARRAKEDELAIRTAFLERENLQLKHQVAALKNQNANLKCLLYRS